MSLARFLGRLGALFVALAGASVAYYGLLVGSATVPRGLDVLLAGEFNVFAAIGIFGVLLALVALAVVAGRGRSPAVSLGALLAVGGFVVLAVPVLSALVALVLLVLGLALFFSGASLNGRRRDAA